jgi:hypothetical protein
LFVVIEAVKGNPVDVDVATDSVRTAAVLKVISSPDKVDVIPVPPIMFTVSPLVIDDVVELSPIFQLVIPAVPVYEIVASPVALIDTPISDPAVIFVIPVLTSVKVSVADTVAESPVPAEKAGVPTLNVIVFPSVMV